MGSLFRGPNKRDHYRIKLMLQFVVGCVRLRNPDFGFCNLKENPKSEFTSKKSVLGVDFSQEI